MREIKDMERAKFIESVIIIIIAAVFNFNSALTYRISVINLIISAAVVWFWFVFMFAGKNSRRLMLWGTGLWGVIAVLTMFSTQTLAAGETLAAGNILTAVFNAPLFGFRCFFNSVYANMAIPLLLSLVLAALGIRFLRLQSAPDAVLGGGKLSLIKLKRR